MDKWFVVATGDNKGYWIWRVVIYIKGTTKYLTPILFYRNGELIKDTVYFSHSPVLVLHEELEEYINNRMDLDNTTFL